MNDNYYWDEYIKFYVDEHIKKNILKFYLSTNNNLFKNDKYIPDFLLDSWKSKLRYNIYPDINISSFHFNTLDSELKTVVDLIVESIKAAELITFLPILSINSDDNTILNFGINIKDKELILYSKYSSNYMTTNKIQYVISYFLNLEESILMYGAEAYTKTILEIGYIKQSLEIKLSNYYLLNEESKPRQEWTHDLAINPNRELLITTTSIGKKL
nr:hypothetical protein [uncultured Clostridium sp.]